ncbi:hypothetical protein B0H17DRAFT_1067547 [Mycena rosella]|uniref:Uncharacterized protein n=1 Tax=Mycena rosella TaxID=1033263 RepID=A0AAD7DFH3_MYCRO|nr:hypothetical protein B0H17DRAFT_1067547 [Mycena rosella]
MEPTFAPRPPSEIIDIDDDSEDEGSEITKKSQPATVPENTFSDFESDGEDDDENEVEQKPLISPSTDIRGDFDSALEDGFDFDGVFAFSERYAMGVAPNPCLNFDGLGTVGIPLSERDARAIISACVAPPNTSGIWELPSEKIHFDNPAWDAWIQNTAGVAAATALNACAPVRPSFSFKKLVIHESSSPTTHYKEPVDEDESNTKIGDFIAVLPSIFQGGQLQLHHTGQVKSLNFAHQSGLATSIVAAYSGVEQTLAGVTSGYRLSLVYDILFPITHADVRPTLPEMQGATQKLYNIMLSWKQDASGEAPGSLACLLHHKYTSTKNFRAQSLTGVDALLISHLYPLARQLKFRIYFAQVRLTVSTMASAPDDGYGCGYGRSYGRGWGRRRYNYYDYDDDDEIDEDEFEDDEGSREESLVLSRVVDLCGMPVNVNIDLEAEDLINGSITDQAADTTNFEIEERTMATRTAVYNRTVLLIWPKDSDADLNVTVGDIYDYACNTLQSSLTVAPTEKERKLVDQLLECCQTRPQEPKLPRVVQVLRESADRWNDVAILLRALKACGVDKNTGRMGPEGFVSAYQAFGWAALKDCYNDAMKNDESNARRHALLARLTQMAADEEDAEVAAWCTAQADSILRSLSKVDAARIPWLADLGLSRGGEFLRDVIFPQLQAQKLDKTFWMPFIQRLQQTMRDIPTTAPDVVSGLIVQCVAQTARNLPAFPTRVIQNPYGYHVTERHEKSSEAVLEVVKLCVETRNEALCVKIFSRMREAARLGNFRAEFPPWLYYAELCASVNLYLQTVPATAAMEAIFRPFFVDAVDWLISAARTAPGGKTITPCPLNEQHKATIMLAARKVGGISVLKQRLTADALKGHDSSTLQGLVRSVAKEFPRQALVHDPVALQAYNDVVIGLVRTAIDTFDTSSLVKKNGPGYPYYHSSVNPSDVMIKLVQFCFELGAQSQCQRLLLRFVPPPTGSTVPQHVSTTLAPFLPVLRQYLVGEGLDFQVDPYKMFAAAMVRAFAEQVMAQKPHEVVPAAQLQGVGCKACAECRELKAFFCSDKSTISFPRVQSIRTHLERYLGVTRAWGVVWETRKYGSPHTLHITKPASMTALGLWATNSQSGKTLLHGLGDPATQTRILGADYAWVYARIYGLPAPPAPLANASQTLNAQKRAAPAGPSTVPAAKKARTS